MHKLLCCIFLFLFVACPLTAATPPDQSSPPSTPIINPQCKKFFKAIGDADNRDPQIAYDKTILATNSGHNINDLGNFGSCNHNSTYYTYLVMQIGVLPQNVSGYVGLCSPSYCSKYDWSNESSWLQTTIPEIGGPNLTNLTFTFIDPLNLDIHTSFGSYLSVFVILACLGLTVAGTFCTSLFDKKEKIESAGTDSHYIRFNDSQNMGSQIPVSSGATSQFFGLNRVASGISSSMNNSNENLERIFRDDEPKTFSQRVFQSFDASRNYDELVGKESRLDYDKNLHLWDGVKFFALFFVILGNVFLLSGMSKNAPNAIYFAQNSWWFLVVTMAPYALDTFLFVSGFIAAYQLIEQLKELPFGLANLLKVYFRRWIRLWPTYVIIILFYWKVLPFLSSGPTWFRFVNFSQACDKTWWKNFLLLDNIITSPVNDHCMVWGISVSLEMQMFLFTPFIIWIYLKDREYGKTSIWVLVLLSIVAGYSFAIQSELPYTVQVNPPPDVNAIFNELVSNPMVHWCTYFIGIYAGILYRNYKNGERNFYYWVQQHWVGGYILAFFSLCLLFVCLIIFPRTEQKNTIKWPQSIVYGWIAAGRLLVVVCIWLVLTPALSGYMKTVKNFLSWGVFKMISNLLYPVVLVNFIVALFIFASDTQFGEFSLSRNMYTTLTVLMVSMVVGALLHLVVERPFVLMAKGITMSKRNRFSLRGLDDAGQNSLVKA